MNRRGFLAGILAAAAAPAIVRADSLMRIVPRETEVLTFDSVPIYWDWDGKPAVWTRAGADFAECYDDIVAQTIRARSAQIVANVVEHNALLARLRGGR